MAKKENGLVTILGFLGALISIGCVIVGFIQSVQIINDEKFIGDECDRSLILWVICDY